MFEPSDDDGTLHTTCAVPAESAEDTAMDPGLIPEGDSNFDGGQSSGSLSDENPQPSEA